MDEISAVFVRRTPQTEELIQRFPVDCATAPLPAQPPGSNRADAFNAWANAGMVLANLGRNSEALTAIGNALSIFPDNAFLRWNRADVLFAMGRLSESEQEYLAAVALEPSAATWTALAESYQKRGRIPASLDARRHAVPFSLRPYLTLLNLGYIYLGVGQPDNALKTFDEAARSAPGNIRAADDGSFNFSVAQGRSGAYEALGNLEKAIAFQEEAVRFAPGTPEPLVRLAQLYRRQGRIADANRASEHAAALASKQPR